MGCLFFFHDCSFLYLFVSKWRSARLVCLYKCVLRRQQGLHRPFCCHCGQSAVPTACDCSLLWSARAPSSCFFPFIFYLLRQPLCSLLLWCSHSEIHFFIWYSRFSQSKKKKKKKRKKKFGTAPTPLINSCNSAQKWKGWWQRQRVKSTCFPLLRTVTRVAINQVLQIGQVSAS